MPPCVPDTATNVHLVNGTHTGGVRVWCDLDVHARSELEARVRKVGWSETRADTAVPPFSFNLPMWNPILGGRMTAPPPADFDFVADGWHGIANRDGRCWITLTSPTKPRNLRGHMLHRIPTVMGRMVMRRPGADA